MRWLVLSASVALAGCATQPQVPIEQLIANASNAELCEAAFYAAPQVAQPSQAEAQRRGVNCQEHMPAIAAQRAQQEASRAAAAQIMLQRRQAIQPIQMPIPVYQPRRQTNCTSQVIGNQVHTNCY